MISKLVSKLATEVLGINILYSKLVSKKRIKTNLKYTVLSS